MAVVIRMARHGTKKKPFYRIVVADSESPRDGRFLEVVGTYAPRSKDKPCELKRDRIEYWMKKGALPSQTVGELLKRTPTS